RGGAWYAPGIRGRGGLRHSPRSYLTSRVGHQLLRSPTEPPRVHLQRLVLVHAGLRASAPDVEAARGPLRAGEPVDPLQVRQVTLDAVRIGHQDAHVDRVVLRGQDGQVGGGEYPHPTNLRTSSIVQSAPRSTTASRHAAGASLPPDGTPESRMTCPLHAVGSPIAAVRAATTGAPPSIDCSICTEPSA